MEITIRKIGNSKGAVIPAPLLKELGVDTGQSMQANVVDGRLIIEKIDTPEYSLEELLAQSHPEQLRLSDDDKAWLNENDVGREDI